MKGLMFNLLENFICDNWSEEKYEDILALCPLKTKASFVGPVSYPDSDLMAIVSKAAEILEVPVDEALSRFGRYAFAKLSARYPHLIESTSTARDFLLTVDSVVHVEVHKMYPGSETPTFSYQDLSETNLIMRYRSKRQLCSLVEGIILGVSDYFNTPITVTQTCCTRSGDAECEFNLVFGG